MEIGIYDYVEVFPDPQTGETISTADRLRNLVEQVELADQLGLEVFGLGEHHRPDIPASAPAVVLGAIAARTQKIRLTSAVTVLSSDDPVRVFQDFATLDLLLGGRAEIMAGRGSFIESFPLFGYDLSAIANRSPSCGKPPTGDREDSVPIWAVRPPALPGADVGRIDGPQADDASPRVARYRSRTGRSKGPDPLAIQVPFLSLDWPDLVNYLTTEDQHGLHVLRWSGR
jgi:hypothetical protein